MKINSANAVNFSYLLLEFYKDISLKEEESFLILMLDHLLAQGNDFITSDTLAIKMNYKIKKIDEMFSHLLANGYIEFINKHGKTKISLEPVKKMLIDSFKKTIFTEEEMEKNKDMEETRSEVFTAFQDIIGRNLSPIEIDVVDNWIATGVGKDIILNSIKDAKLYGKTSIKEIDRLVINRLKEEDNFGNDIARKK